MKKDFLFLFLLIFNLFFAFESKAAVLFFETSSFKYYLNDVFLIDLKINTENELINAAQIEINFPEDKLEIVDFIKNGSIFIFWPEEPKLNEEGKISFVGGVPKGFKGEGKILSIAFKVIFNGDTQTNGEIKLNENSMVLLNDGFGTNTKLTIKNLNLQLYPFSLEKPKNELKEILKNDQIPPEPFSIFLTKTPLFFEEKYFISFFALDFQTGISHYEIQEGNSSWKKTKLNFYLLEDQSLKSEIKVKAVDKAGNERLAILKF